MALTITSPQDGQKKLKTRLKAMEREISFLCANYRKELAKPILSIIPNQENVFELLFVGILTWVLSIGLFALEFIIVSDLPNSGISIMMAVITISTELLALYSIDKINRDNRFSGLEEQVSLELHLLKFIPIGLNAWVAYSRIEAFLSDGSTMSNSLLIGGGYFLIFLFVYGFLLYMANRGMFLENLMSPFELIKRKKEIREQRNNSRNEEVLVQSSQDIRTNVDNWVNGTNRYGTIYNPIGENGEPNEDFIKVYGKRQHEKFIYEPYQHSLNNEDIATITSLVGQIITQNRGTQQVGEGNNIDVVPESTKPQTGLGTGNPPPNDNFNEPRGIVL